MMTLFFKSWIARGCCAITRYICDRHLPKWSRTWVLTCFSKIFGIIISEAEKPLKDYPSINAFFTRGLKPNARPITANQDSLICPVDGTLLQANPITNDQVIQAKGVTYSLQQLMVMADWERFKNGYSITLYLSPKDCHRIYAPVTGNITKSAILPGHIFPVRSPYVEHMPGLFAQNERIVTLINTHNTTLAMIHVAAFNVSSITTTYDPELVTTPRQKAPQIKTYSPHIAVTQGEWVSTFHLGSTVILLLEGQNHKCLHPTSQPVQIGQPLLH